MGRSPRKSRKVKYRPITARKAGSQNPSFTTYIRSPFGSFPDHLGDVWRQNVSRCAPSTCAEVARHRRKKSPTPATLQSMRCQIGHFLTKNGSLLAQKSQYKISADRSTKSRGSESGFCDLNTIAILPIFDNLDDIWRQNVSRPSPIDAADARTTPT